LLNTTKVHRVLPKQLLDLAESEAANMSKRKNTGRPSNETIDPSVSKPKHTNKRYSYKLNRAPMANSRGNPSTLSPRTPPTIEHKPGTPYLEWFAEEDAGGALAAPSPSPKSSAMIKARSNVNEDEVADLEDWIEVINDTTTPV
jgi:hypothetical protein